MRIYIYIYSNAQHHLFANVFCLLNYILNGFIDRVFQLAARNKCFELWNCPEMDGSAKMAILAKVNMQDKEMQITQDIFATTVKGKQFIREAFYRLFRDWQRDRQVRFVDLWGNVAPKGADNASASIMVPVKDGKHWNVKDLQAVIAEYIVESPNFRKKKEEYLK